MKPKTDLLFLSYLEGIPNQNSGGPNHVIYDYLKYESSSFLKKDFLSYGSFIENLTISKAAFEKEHLIGIKKITNGLFYKSSIFKKIVTNDFYQPIHFKKRNLYFNKHIDTKEYMIIHSHDSISNSFTTSQGLAKKIMTVHNYCPYSIDFTQNIQNDFIRTNLFRSIRNQELLAMKLSDVITFPSRAVKEFFENEMIIDSEKDVRIIYNGIDIEWIQKVSNDKSISDFTKRKFEHDLIILSVASHERNKRLDIALSVVKELVHKYKREVLFINVGRGSETSKLIALTKKYQIEKNVVFIEILKHEEIIWLMKNCDYFLHTSEKVVFDLVILEAMASGLCVIAADEGGNREIIKHNQNGVLVSLNEVETYAKHFIEVNPKLMSANALSTVKNYTNQVTAQQYHKIYRDLL